MDRLPEIDDAVQDLAEAVGRRIVLVDEMMRVVAYSIHETPADRRRLFQMLAHSDSWPAPRTGRNAYSVEVLPEIGAVLFLRLLDPRQHIIGHLLMPAATGEQPATGEATPIDIPTATTVPAEAPGPVLTEAAGMLAELLSARRQEQDQRDARSRQLTVELVSGEATTREAAAEELLAERLLSSAAGYCAVALGVDPRTATPLGQEKTTQAVARTLRFVRETSTATVVGGTLDNHIGVLVFPRPVVLPRLARILRHPDLVPVRAGVGSMSRLADIHRSFNHARLAWRASWLAPEDHGVATSWEEVGLDGTLARLPVEEFTRDDLPPTTRDLLAAVDSPTLIATLETYLDTGGDAQRTARELHIHRSTLYYRLDKIRAVISGDLSDGVFRRDLHTGLRLARLAGLRP